MFNIPILLSIYVSVVAKICLCHRVYRHSSARRGPVGGDRSGFCGGYSTVAVLAAHGTEVVIVDRPGVDYHLGKLDSLRET